MARTIKPSPTQTDALTRMVATGSNLERWPGGFWTTAGSDRRDGGPGVGWVPMPWHTGTQTVRALESRGWIERANVYPEDWRDERRITDAGRALATPTPAKES